MARYCGNCGEQTIQEDNYCTNCGRRIRANDNTNAHTHSKHSTTKTQEPIGSKKPIGNPVEYVSNCYINYAKFDGRARRAEFWFFLLFFWLASFVLAFIDAMLGMYNYELSIGLLSFVFIVVSFIPFLAVYSRRLRDVGISGWMLLPGFIPIVGLALFIVAMTKSVDGDNKYGQNPLRNRFKD